MKADDLILKGGRVFDGHTMHKGWAVCLAGDRIKHLGPEGTMPTGTHEIDLAGDILCPMFVDLQVNGGGGAMLNDAPTEDGLAAIAQAHRSAGTGFFLPTLITDSPDVTDAAVEAVASTSVAGVAGLHLEGPHIAAAKKGAHPAEHIRPLDDKGVEKLITSARRLPRLVVTLAPEAAPLGAITALANKGVVVSIGHSAATYEAAMAAFGSGATMATHLFNAMGPIHHRDPGLAGAALACPDVSAGLIADGVHVHPALLGQAIRGKAGSERMFLVTDAMAPFGTDDTTFTLSGRTVLRDGIRLSLADGTLAGANASLLEGIRLLVGEAQIPLETALGMATGAPARAARLPQPAGTLAIGGQAPLRIAGDLSAIRPIET